ncbi:hypothetical protein SPRG_15320, partial [Saprolegnia parasitica CBS 223.65]
MRSFSPLLVLLFMLHTTAALTVNGNSTFDNQVNRILHWNGDDFSSLGFGPEAVAGITIAIGTVLTFFGYKLVRPAIFVAGFIVGAVACFLLAERIFANASYIVTACWIAFVLGGLLVG